MHPAAPWRISTVLLAGTTLALLAREMTREPAPEPSRDSSVPAPEPAPMTRVHVAQPRDVGDEPTADRTAAADADGARGDAVVAQQRALLDGLSTDDVLARYVTTPAHERAPRVGVDVVIARLARDRATVVPRIEDWLDHWDRLLEAGFPLQPDVFQVYGALAGGDAIARLRAFGPDAPREVGCRQGAVEGLVRAGDSDVLALLDPRVPHRDHATIDFAAGAIPGTPGMELVRGLAFETPTGPWRPRAVQLLWFSGDDADRERLLAELPTRELIADLGGAGHYRDAAHAARLRRRIEEALDDTDVHVRLLAERVLLPAPDVRAEVPQRLLDRARRDIELNAPPNSDASEFARLAGAVRERVRAVEERRERDAARRRTLGLE